MTDLWGESFGNFSRHMWRAVCGAIRAVRGGGPETARGPPPVEVGAGPAGHPGMPVYLTLTALQAAPTVLYSVLVVPYRAPAADSVAVRAAL